MLVWAWTLLLVSGAAGAIRGGPLHLDEGNWTLTLEGEWLVEFMAPWCPACTALKDTWADVAVSLRPMGVKVADVDVTIAPGLSGRFLVTALPTIYHVKDSSFRQYKGPRDKSSLLAYIKEQQWEDVDPLPWWKDPNSLQMSYVSYFFRMSQMLRVVHNILLETYGLPTWGSYIVFALVTILLGSLIGLLLVACIDCIYPHKSAKRPQAKPEQARVEKEVMNDDLVDEADLSDPSKSDDDDYEEKNSPPDSENSESEKEDEDDNAEKESPSPIVRRRKNPRKD